MLPLKRLKQVNNLNDVLNCIYDGLQIVIDGLSNGKPALDILPQTNLFLTGTLNHLHPHPELILTCVGHGWLDVLDGCHPINPHKLVVTPRGLAHLERPRYEQKTYANIIIGCGSKRMSSHVRITRPGQTQNHISNRIVIHDQRMHRVSRYFDEACSAHGNEVHAPNACSTGLCLAAASILADIAKDALASNQQEQNAQDHLITLARSYIEQHLATTHLRISDIAKAIGCSADYLSHRFHQLTDQHLNHYITEQRLSFSCTLLSEGNLGIEEIARAVGYQDPGYFSRCFKQAYGLSPRDWRKAL